MAGPELLAPAGDWEALVAAVQNGADAVYLGATTFNARQSAANFTPPELVRAVDYAHVRDVKVYVTMNILLADGELDEAVRLAGFLYNTGVDAVIVQDLGLMRLLRELLPGLAVHASTQATAHNLPTLELLKELGVRRVVLARELSLEEITHLRAQSGMEVEVFIHGALCVCYSGQCLMSSLIGGRSGNRGRCAQPCRLPYTLLQDGAPAGPEATGRYLLSTRDLNLSAHLPELVRTGVDALKIEGRLRRPEYVATVVRVYRRLLDRALVGDFTVSEEERRELIQIFNRGFSTGYYFDHLGYRQRRLPLTSEFRLPASVSGKSGRTLMGYSRPNNRGLELGRVRRSLPGSKLVEIELDAPLHSGDTIEVWVSVGGRISTVVREMQHDGRLVEAAPAGAVVSLPLEGRTRSGDRVFKTRDDQLERRARDSFGSAREEKKLPLRFRVTVAEGAPLRLEITDPNGFAAATESRSPAVRAEKRPLSQEVLRAQFDRLGNTPFALGELEARIEGQVMLPLRELNEVRRQALEALENLKIQARRPSALDQETLADRRRLYRRQRSVVRDAGRWERPRLTVTVGELTGVRVAVEAGADVIYFPGEGLGSSAVPGIKEVREAAALCHRGGAALVLWLPRIVRDREWPRWQRLLEEAGPFVAGLLAGNPGALGMTGGPKELVADFTLNTFNGSTLALLAELGATRATLSPEMTLEQIRDVAREAPVALEVLVHGSLPMMVSEYCAAGGLADGGDGRRCPALCRTGGFALEDRIGLRFPVGLDPYCRMHIFNAKDLCAVEQVPELIRCGITAFRVEGRLRGADYLRGVLEIYREVLDKGLQGGEGRDASEYRERLGRMSPQGLTFGHYFRGVCSNIDGGK